jgi:hypothetical protein
MHEAFSKTFSVKMDIDRVAMLQAICDRFNQSVSGFAGEILGNHVDVLFTELTTKDRLDLAIKADDIARKMYDKIGAKVESSNGDGNFYCTKWPIQDRFVSNNENEAK